MYKQNMQNLVDTIVASGKTAIVALVPPKFGNQFNGVPFVDPTTSAVNGLIQEYNDVITTELTNITVGPNLYKCFLEEQNRFSLFSDNYHFNALGYDFVARIWRNIIDGTMTYFDACTPPRFIVEDLLPYTYKQNLLEVGDQYYIDSSNTLTSIPSQLENGIWIMTADADKTNTSLNYLSFSVDRNVTVYVAYDSTATSIPDWLNNNFTSSGFSVDVDTGGGSASLDVYQADYFPGNIVLGGNLATGAIGASSNYIAIVVEN